MFFIRDYSVWRVLESSGLENNLSELVSTFRKDKSNFRFVCCCRDLSAFSGDILYCQEVNSFHEFIVFVR